MCSCLIVPLFGPEMMQGNYSAIEFCNMTKLNPENFAMVTLKLGSVKALKTVRTTSSSTTGMAKGYVYMYFKSIIPKIISFDTLYYLSVL